MKPLITHDASGWTISAGGSTVTAKTAQSLAKHLAYWMEACADLRRCVDDLRKAQNPAA